MSGLHLVKQGRDRRRIDLQRDFTVASPAEFVTRFGGNKVIEKVMICTYQSDMLKVLSQLCHIQADKEPKTKPMRVMTITLYNQYI